MRRLRAKLGEALLLETVRAPGYKLRAPHSDHTGPSAAERADTTDSDQDWLEG